jgi:hypothetical protein
MPKISKEEQKIRLAEALRANLRRRKKVEPASENPKKDPPRRRV